MHSDVERIPACFSGAMTPRELRAKKLQSFVSKMSGVFPNV
jgi:hypothetical protein